MNRLAWLIPIQSTICLVLIALLSYGCMNDERQLPPRNARLSIDLRWIKAYSRETKADVETGLLWGLSFLGAALPRDAHVFSWNNNIVTVDLERARVVKGTEESWGRLLVVLKESDEYRAMRAVDIGRFMALTVCSSNHYFALTGASTTYEELPRKRKLEAKRVAIVESSVARGNRLLDVGEGSNFGDILFVAHEGNGSIKNGTFHEEESEVVDSMANGQLRFALYDVSGKLKPAANPSLSVAGKPGKCLWCHEVRLQRTFISGTDLDGYYSRREFDSIVADRMRILNLYRSNLKSKVDFTRLQDHTYAELLYISFFEPSLERLAGEWGVPIEQAELLLRDVGTHVNDEFSFLGSKLYRRKDVDGLAPYKTVGVPTDPREPSFYEPDLLR